MTNRNPDFRGADVVERPADIDAVCGWTDGHTDEPDAIDHERRALDTLQGKIPVAFKQRDPVPAMREMLAKWNAFQESKGRYPGSADWSLFDEFVFGVVLVWLPQLIGSCVVSNTFRPWVLRLAIQIVLRGKPQEYLGRDEFGPRNLSFYAPMSYGLARRRANMRGGDGLYAAPMAESLMMDGVLPCNTPALLELLAREGLDGQNDFPEPQGSRGQSLYRAFGKWRHLDDLAPYCDFALTESPTITSADQLWAWLQGGGVGDGKTAFVCSMEAIRKVGEHPDGFAIHARDPFDRWAHNMSFVGCFVASDGDRFFRESNESWGREHIYNRRFDEVEKAFRAGRLTVQGIGEINGPAWSPPAIG